MAADLASRHGMVINTRRRKKIRAVNDQKLDCSGTVTFDIEFEGRSMEVVALVSSSITNEVLLSWHTLKKIGVIPDDFPHVGVKAAAVTMLPVVGDVDACAGGDAVKTEQDARDAITRMIEEFGSVFDEEGQLRAMKGEPMTIHKKKDVTIKPLHICTPRKTPYAYHTAAKAKLDEDEENGIIEKVEGPSPWCSAMSFVLKPGGKVRYVLELVHLNRYVERPTHTFPAPKDIVAQIPSTSTGFRGVRC
jgi:hypothetical protein